MTKTITALLDGTICCGVLPGRASQSEVGTHVGIGLSLSSGAAGAADEQLQLETR
jgi:hypothetical protein